MKATKLQYSTRDINRDFKIKVYGYTEEGKKVDKLVGVSGLILLIGTEHVNKQIERAGLKVVETHDGIGQGHTILEVKLK